MPPDGVGNSVFVLEDLVPQGIVSGVVDHLLRAGGGDAPPLDEGGEDCPLSGGGVAAGRPCGGGGSVGGCFAAVTVGGGGGGGEVGVFSRLRGEGEEGVGAPDGGVDGGGGGAGGLHGCLTDRGKGLTDWTLSRHTRSKRNVFRTGQARDRAKENPGRAGAREAAGRVHRSGRAAPPIRARIARMRSATNSASVGGGGGASSTPTTTVPSSSCPR